MNSKQAKAGGQTNDSSHNSAHLNIYLLMLGKGKGKGKVHPITDYKGPERGVDV